LLRLKHLGLEANILGQKTPDLTRHPLVKPSLQAVAETYNCAHTEENRSLFRVRSSLTGEEINRFNHLHQSTADLTNKVIMQRTCGNITGCCFQRCVGMDAANAVFSVTYECDQAHGTSYHQRFC
jgi:4-hydroxybutyryl-CoA dehydratase / vinylacetyl-CoA-Delta-isomerase